MKKVIVESPYAGDVSENIRYARRCLADCLCRGEAPFASHLLYTQEGVLDDRIPEERKLGIEAGLVWGAAADETVVYVDRGISKGMIQGILRATADGRPIWIRRLELPGVEAYRYTDMMVTRYMETVQEWFTGMGPQGSYLLIMDLGNTMVHLNCEQGIFDCLNVAIALWKSK